MMKRAEKTVLATGRPESQLSPTNYASRVGSCLRMWA